MKQSTKLLSLVLALLMAFSCMSVIGSAALARNEVNYDCIDDADLTVTTNAHKGWDISLPSSNERQIATGRRMPELR